MMKRWILTVLLSLCGIPFSFSQQPDVENLLFMIENGRAEEIRAELPSLLNQYPNNSGVLYLQAVLTKDGSDAVGLYQEIVDKYPAGEWADDALYKVYQFYSAIGLNRTADLKFSQLRARYPNSKYLSESVDLTTGQPSQQTTPPETQSTNGPVNDQSEETIRPVEKKSPDKFTLQVGVYSTLGNATKQKQFFEYQNYSAEIVSKMKDDRELFVVYVGGYATAEEARTRGEKIKQTFDIHYLVVSR